MEKKERCIDLCSGNGRLIKMLLSHKSEEIKNIATTTNNLFVGSTAELQKILKKETDLVNVTPKTK